TGWEYRCSNSANYRKVDSTGWIPVPFTSISFGSNLAILPIDPINTTSTGNYYTYVPGGSWKLTSLFESEKYAKNMNKDGGPDPGVYEIGTNLNLANFARGLVGYWKFDEGSGTAAGDSSGNNNIGTLINSPTWTSGKVSGALSFDGVDDYVDVGNNLEWPGALTVSTWHRRTTKDTVRADGIVGNWFWDPDTQLRRGWVIRYYINTDSLVFMIELTNGSLVTERHLGFTMSVGEWYHVVGVFNPDRTTKLYVNGVLRATDTAPAGYNQIAYDSPYPMLIGYNPVNAGYFPGLIDEVRIYNRALSAAEITAIYNATK
ncbi:MAG: LamG domain-containing protein, partial [bacterium]|nr:LamG domain-containing protein [bacterium]